MIKLESLGNRLTEVWKGGLESDNEGLSMAQRVHFIFVLEIRGIQWNFVIRRVACSNLGWGHMMTLAVVRRMDWKEKWLGEEDNEERIFQLSRWQCKVCVNGGEGADM